MTNTADRLVSTASYAGGAVSVASGLTLTEWGVAIGIATAVLTFVANLVYQARKDSRDRHLHNLQAELLERERSRHVNTL